MLNENDVGNIAISFFKFSMQMKIYHYQTKLYSHHKIVDELLDKTQDKFDLILESLQGIVGKKLNIKANKKIDVYNCNEQYIIKFLSNFREYVDEILKEKCDEYPEIINMCDEIIGQIDKSLYLFKFR